LIPDQSTRMFGAVKACVRSRVKSATSGHGFAGPIHLASAGLNAVLARALPTLIDRADLPWSPVATGSTLPIESHEWRGR